MRCPRCQQKIQHLGEAHGRIEHGAQIECAPPLNPMATAFARAGIESGRSWRSAQAPFDAVPGGYEPPGHRGKE